MALSLTSNLEMQRISAINAAITSAPEICQPRTERDGIEREGSEKVRENNQQNRHDGRRIGRFKIKIDTHTHVDDKKSHE